VKINDLEAEYRGGDRNYSLVFVLPKTRKSVRISAAEKDDVPAPLAKLLDALWETRRKDYRNSENTEGDP